MTTVQLPPEVESAREITLQGGDILLVRHSADLPDFGRQHLQGWARDLVNRIGEEKPIVVICPQPTDITAMPREEAVRQLREQALAIGCDIVDQSEPFVFRCTDEQKAEILRLHENDRKLREIRPLSEHIGGSNYPVRMGSPIFVRQQATGRWAWWEDRECTEPFLSGTVRFEDGQPIKQEPLQIVSDDEPTGAHVMQDWCNRRQVARPYQRIDK